jgi:carbamoyl-phosphate synthase large subunit
MQLIVDTDGRLHVVECNARFGGASTASIKVGVDSLRWSLLESCGADMTLHPFHRAATEVRQIRVPADVHVYDPRI